MIRRSKIEVFSDIIKFIAEECEVKRTRLMFKANLAWKVLKDAMEFLEDRGLVKSEVRDSRVSLSLTNEGYVVLNRFRELENIFDTQAMGGPAENGPVLAAPKVPYYY